MDEGSLKAPTQIESSPVLAFDQTMGVLVQVKAEEIILICRERDDKLKPTMEFVLPIVSQPHSYALYCPNLEIEVNITKETPLSFLMNRFFRNEVLHVMFPLSACQTLHDGLWLFGYYVSCDKHDSYIH